jgi:probable F420-dependent oxidoreductase
MPVGLFAPLAVPGLTVGLARALGPAAEERGFDSIWVPEHVVTFDPPPGRRDRFPGGEHGSLDPFVALTWLAAHTKTLRLGTGVLLVSQRQPLFTAKEVASLDLLSGGRVDLGVGLGWVPDEFAALGLRRAERGRLADRAIGTMVELWTAPEPELEQDEGRVLRCRAFPKPAQRPHPPLHVGGHSDAALARVARVGQGWFAFGLDPVTFGERVEALDRVLDEHGRRRSEITVSVCPYGQPLDRGVVARYADLGADRIVLPAVSLTEHDLDTRLDHLAGVAAAGIR